jgi:hypothetical protein
MLWMADAKVASREVGGAALDEVRCTCELEAAVPVVVQVGRGGAPRRPEGVDVEESSLMSARFFSFAIDAGEHGGGFLCFLCLFSSAFALVALLGLVQLGGVPLRRGCA